MTDNAKRDPTELMEALLTLYESAQGTHLAQVLLESIAASRYHGCATIRLGASRDGSLQVFSAEPEVAHIMGEILLASGRPVHIGQVPAVDGDALRALLASDEVFSALTAPATTLVAEPDEIYDQPTPDGWYPGRARAYLTRAVEEGVADGDVLTEMEITMIRAALEEPDCGSTEARFRILLNEALHWKADKLDPAVLQVRSRS